MTRIILPNTEIESNLTIDELIQEMHNAEGYGKEGMRTTYNNCDVYIPLSVFKQAILISAF